MRMMKIVESRLLPRRRWAGRTGRRLGRPWRKYERSET